MKDVFGESAEAVADILRWLNYSFSDVAGAVKTAFTLGVNRVAQILLRIGSSATQAIEILKGLFSDLAAIGAAILDVFGVSV